VVPLVEDAVAAGKPVTFPVDPCTVADDGVGDPALGSRGTDRPGMRRTDR
jgi:hypothetical protein